VRQRAVTAMLLGLLSLVALMLGLGNLRRGIFVAVLALLFAGGHRIYLNPWAADDEDSQGDEIPVGVIEEYPDEP